MGRQQKLADQRHGTILPRRQLRSFRLRNSDRSVKTYATDALTSNVPVSFNGKTAETCRSAARDDFAEEAAPVVPTAELRSEREDIRNGRFVFERAGFVQWEDSRNLPISGTGRFCRGGSSGRSDCGTLALTRSTAPRSTRLRQLLLHLRVFLLFQ